MYKRVFFEEKGQSLVLMAVMLAALIGIAGIVIDGGRLYLAKSELQKAVDAGALAGADALIDNYLQPNINFDSTAVGKVKGIADSIASRNYTAKNYAPSADYVPGRKDNYYIVQGAKEVQLMLMPILNIADTAEVKAYARVKIVTDTKPGINSGDIIPIGIESIPDVEVCEICKLVANPGMGATGNYNFLNFSKIELPEVVLTKQDCNSSEANIDSYIMTGPPPAKPISVDWNVCSKPGESDTQISNAINNRIANGKANVYVPIISGYGTGTSSTVVLGFVEVELQAISKDDKNHDIYGKIIKEIAPEDFDPVTTFTSKLDL